MVGKQLDPTIAKIVLSIVWQQTNVSSLVQQKNCALVYFVKKHISVYCEYFWSVHSFQKNDFSPHTAIFSSKEKEMLC